MEWIGYAASAIVALSLLITNVWYFRWINMAGALLFCIYGLLIGSMPVALMNGLITGINVYFIIQMFHKVDYFHYITVTYRDSKFLQYFIRFYTRDISYHFPRLFLDKLDPEQKFTLVIRNAVTVGVFSYHIDGQCGVIDLDYVIPAYRDLKNMRYLLGEALATRFEQENITSLRVQTNNKRYAKHLKVAGFKNDKEKANTYVLKLPLV